MRSTHTYVVMELSPAAHAEIKAKMLAAGYGHAIDGEAIDMHGIAVEPDGSLAEAQAEIKRRTGLTVNLTSRHGIVDREDGIDVVIDSAGEAHGSPQALENFARFCAARSSLVA